MGSVSSSTSLCRRPAGVSTPNHSDCFRILDTTSFLLTSSLFTGNREGGEFQNAQRTIVSCQAYGTPGYGAGPLTIEIQGTFSTQNVLAHGGRGGGNTAGEGFLRRKLPICRVAPVQK